MFVEKLRMEVDIVEGSLLGSLHDQTKPGLSIMQKSFRNAIVDVIS